MRRIPIYVFVGPFVTWLVAITIAALSQTDPVFDDDRMIIASLFAAYGLTLLPLVLIAHLDRRLAGRPHPWRILACTAAGFAWIVALQAGLALEGGHGELFWQSWPCVGLVGALPAATCAVVAGWYPAVSGRSSVHPSIYARYSRRHARRMTRAPRKVGYAFELAYLGAAFWAGGQCGREGSSRPSIKRGALISPEREQAY